MLTFFRIGSTYAISLDPANPIASLTVADDDELAHVSLVYRSGGSAVVTPTDQDYEQYVAFIRNCPPLVDELEAQKLRAIQAGNAHPYYDEMPRTLFAIFQSLPTAHLLELRLAADGAGSLWTRGEDAGPVHEWPDFATALVVMQRLQRHFTEEMAERRG